MSILNNSITPHGSPSMIRSKSAAQFRRYMMIVASGQSSSEPCNNREQLGAEHQRQVPVLHFTEDDAIKQSGLHHKGHVCNFVSGPVTCINPKKLCKKITEGSEFKPLCLGSVSSVMDNKLVSMMKDKISGLDIFGSELAADTLVVSVSSAVKLQPHQMDQIAKKMQRLTGAIRVSIKNAIDRSLIAGFVISYEKEGIQTIDLSVKGQLDQLVARIESNDQRIESNTANYIFMNKES